MMALYIIGEIIMMKQVITLSVLALSGCKIAVPYYEDLDPKYVCGDYPSPYCQPNSSTQFSKIKSGKDYDGKPKNYLGRSFENFFETTPCVSSEVNSNDVVVSGLQNVTGTLSTQEQKSFSNKLSADILELVQMNGVPVPEGYSAEVSAEVERSIKNTDSSDIQLEYKRIDLSQEFMDAHLQNCLAQTPKTHNVSTGISVITVSGSWASDKVVDTLAALEAKASYSNLSNDAKAEFQQAKNRAMNGEFKPVSFVFAVAHRKGKL